MSITDGSTAMGGNYQLKGVGEYHAEFSEELSTGRPIALGEVVYELTDRRLSTQATCIRSRTGSS